MAARRALRTPGYEPAKQGRPDPIPPVTHPHQTHVPAGGGIGALCGKQPVPTHASEYNPEAPTCPWCLNYITKTKAATVARTAPQH